MACRRVDLTCEMALCNIYDAVTIINQSLASGTGVRNGAYVDAHFSVALLSTSRALVAAALAGRSAAANPRCARFRATFSYDRVSWS